MKVDVNKNRKGLVILAVLWTIVVLMVIVAVLGRTSRLDMKVAMARMAENTENVILSRGGMQT